MIRLHTPLLTSDPYTCGICLAKKRSISPHEASLFVYANIRCPRTHSLNQLRIRASTIWCSPWGIEYLSLNKQRCWIRKISSITTAAFIIGGRKLLEQIFATSHEMSTLRDQNKFLRQILEYLQGSLREVIRMPQSGWQNHPGISITTINLQLSTLWALQQERWINTLRKQMKSLNFRLKQLPWGKIELSSKREKKTKKNSLGEVATIRLDRGDLPTEMVFETARQSQSSFSSWLALSRAKFNC